jgi:tetratricopeptide (TPR) repeat protein
MSNPASVYCTNCGTPVEGNWAFCRGCGTALVPGLEPQSRAEALSSPAEEAAVAAAERLLRAGSIIEAKESLDDALRKKPDSYAIHYERACLLARLGLYPQATDDLTAARRLLPLDEVRELLRCQELDRWLRDKSKNSFVREAALPRIPGWLPGIGRSRDQGPRR